MHVGKQVDDVEFAVAADQVFEVASGVRSFFLTSCIGLPDVSWVEGCLMLNRFSRKGNNPDVRPPGQGLIFKSV